MTPDKAQELYGALALLQGFMPFLERLLPEQAPKISEALSLTHDTVRALERTGNMDDARAILAAQIQADWQARLDQKP